MDNETLKTVIGFVLIFLFFMVLYFGAKFPKIFFGLIFFGSLAVVILKDRLNS